MPKRDYSHVPQVRIPAWTREQLDMIQELERRPRPYGAIIAELVAHRLRDLTALAPQRAPSGPRRVDTRAPG